MRLKRLCYSEILLEEKQYGYVQDKMLRAKRKGQASIGRIRTQIADRLMDSAERDAALVKKASVISQREDLKDNPKISISNNKNIAKGLFRHSKSNGGRIFPGSPGNSVFVPKTKELVSAANTALTRGNNDRLTDIKAKHLLDPKTTSMIYLGSNSLDSLAHELGHQSRYVNNNPISKHSMKTSSSFSNWVAKGPKRQSIRDNNIVDVAIKSGSRLLEERGATKHGLKLLKKHGATEDQLLRSKRILDVAGSTYGYAAKASMKGLLSDLVQIPSKRYKGNSKLVGKEVPTPKKPIVTREVRTIPTVSTPYKKLVSTKPITPIRKPM